ncbi:hypothetical protein ABMA28_003169 [Loxostege sticticalis]|uniref:Uncharacterized protein n=1 Tax=Loxostege sticticalis TaxID=481309 RepID=A0ABD0SV91_LOXSC
MPQTAEERKENNKNAEKRRREKMKENPELHNAIKAKALERYYRRKATGQIIPAHEMDTPQKNAKRLKDRVKSKLYRERKKQLANRANEEDLIFCEIAPTAQDPLSTPPHEPPTSPGDHPRD